MSLVKFHLLKQNTGKFEPGDLIWINPAYVVAVLSGHKTGAHQHARIRLQGDTNHQDWTHVWETPENVSAFVNVVATHAD